MHIQVGQGGTGVAHSSSDSYNSQPGGRSISTYGSKEINCVGGRQGIGGGVGGQGAPHFKQNYNGTNSPDGDNYGNYNQAWITSSLGGHTRGAGGHGRGRRRGVDGEGGTRRDDDDDDDDALGERGGRGDEERASVRRGRGRDRVCGGIKSDRAAVVRASGDARGEKAREERAFRRVEFWFLGVRRQALQDGGDSQIHEEWTERAHECVERGR